MNRDGAILVERNRYGYTIDGEFYRRVTTFCGGIPKPWLGGWAAKMVAEFAVEHRDSWLELPKTDAMKLLKGAPWSKRDDAGDRGTAVHLTLEAIVRGQPIPDDLNEDELACAIAAEEFLQAEPWKPLGSEVTVFNNTYGYAGTFDLLAKDAEERTWMLDWKTAASGVYAEMAVQQAAYHNAEFAVVRRKPAGKPDEEKWIGELVEWGPHRADRLGIVHVTPEKAKLYPIREEEIKRLWTVFRAAAHVKQWLLDVDSSYGKRPRVEVYEEPVATIGEAVKQTA